MISTTQCAAISVGKIEVTTRSRRGHDPVSIRA